MLVFINQEYSHHECDFCGTEGKGISWRDSASPPPGWSFKFKAGPRKTSIRLDRCLGCKGKQP